MQISKKSSIFAANSVISDIFCNLIASMLNKIPGRNAGEFYLYN